LSPEETLYSESASRLLVSVPPQHRERFEGLFAGQHFALLGKTTDDVMLTIAKGGEPYLSLAVEELARAWKDTLSW
jgi:phosphoribosylformylglycinamidine synthase subunit PurSL